MAMAVTKAGQSRADQFGLACSALDVQLGSASLELPAHSATYADYGHASGAGEPLEARVFNYYHRTSRGYPITLKETQANIESRVREVQERHSPPLTLISLEHAGDLGEEGLGAFHALQVRMGLPVITTVERNPMQGLDALRGELEAFDRLDTDQERLPTISVRCGTADFRAKLLHVVKNYGAFNLQWGGYGENSARWSVLSATLREHAAWCNIVGILNRGVDVTARPGRRIRTTGVVRPLLYGGHSYCFAWPHVRSAPGAGGGGAGGRGTPRPGGRRGGGAEGEAGQQARRAELFDPGTWLYGPSALGYSTARTRSFNAIQRALGAAREAIVAGTLYSGHCPRAPGLGETLGQSGMPQGRRA